MRDHEEQLGFELGGKEQSPGFPNLREVREDLDAMLADARNATVEGPWDLPSLRYKKIVFLQLVKLLPDDEADQLRFDFMGEVERIELLLAA